MKKNGVLFVIFLSLFVSMFLLLSCTQNFSYKTVNIEIPQHPWEENSSKKMWYTLKWTYNDTILSQHINSDTRNITIRIPVGETVFICAFPLGEMIPFATAITPLDEKLIYVLNQNEGYLAKEFMNLDADVRSKINFGYLVQACYSKTDDFRQINMVDLLQDALNGHLTKASVKIKSPSEVPELSVLDGVWISENQHDNLMDIKNAKTPVMYLPPGIHRYYCPQISREIRISIDYDGTLHATMRQALL